MDAVRISRKGRGVLESVRRVLWTKAIAILPVGNSYVIVVFTTGSPSWKVRRRTAIRKGETAVIPVLMIASAPPHCVWHSAVFCDCNGFGGSLRVMTNEQRAEEHL